MDFADRFATHAIHVGAMAWIISRCRLRCKSLARVAIARRPCSRRACGMHASQCRRLRLSTGSPHIAHARGLRALLRLLAFAISASRTGAAARPCEAFLPAAIAPMRDHAACVLLTSRSDARRYFLHASASRSVRASPAGSGVGIRANAARRVRAHASAEPRSCICRWDVAESRAMKARSSNTSSRNTSTSARTGSMASSASESRLR